MDQPVRSCRSMSSVMDQNQSASFIRDSEEFEGALAASTKANGEWDRAALRPRHTFNRSKAWKSNAAIFRENAEPSTAMTPLFIRTRARSNFKTDGASAPRNGRSSSTSGNRNVTDTTSRAFKNMHSTKDVTKGFRRSDKNASNKSVDCGKVGENLPNVTNFIGEYLLNLWENQYLCDVTVSVSSVCPISNELLVMAWVIMTIYLGSIYYVESVASKWNNQAHKRLNPWTPPN